MFLSIIIPTYQRPAELERCLNSIDIVDDFEIIVSDNASSHDPIKCIPDRLRPFCRLIVRDSNIGPRENIFQASHLATGEFSLYITDDDFFLPGELPILVSQLKNKKTDIGYASCIVHYEKQNKKRFYGFPLSLLGRAGAIIRGHILSGLVVRTELLKVILHNNADILRRTWYFSIGILCMVKTKPYLHKRPLLIHTWENETFWGIDPGNYEILVADQKKLFIAMRSANNLSAIEHSLLKMSLNKYAIFLIKVINFIGRHMNSKMALRRLL